MESGERVADVRRTDEGIEVTLTVNTSEPCRILVGVVVHLEGQEAQKAASLSVGSSVTFRGQLKDRNAYLRESRGLLISPGELLPAPPPATITTVAGTGDRGFSGDGGPATGASLHTPRSVAVDASGNLFIADERSNRIRRVDAATGVITTVAGNGDESFSGDGGLATSASLSAPDGVAVDASGNLFIADRGSFRIRRVDAATGIITTVAGNGDEGISGDGGPATGASLRTPWSVAVDASGNLFIASHDRFRIRRVDAATGVITTVAGNGKLGPSRDGSPATDVSLNIPSGMAVDASGNLFVAEHGSSLIRRVDAATGVITTVAGNHTFGFSGDGGPPTAAKLNRPVGVAVDASGNLFIADYGNSRIRGVNAATGIITTVAGNGDEGFSGDGGPATSASLDEPYFVAVDASGNLFIADSDNNRVRRVSLTAAASAAVAAELEMKLPLPGGKSWLLTVEAGGRVTSLLGGGEDQFHTDARSGFYALDFDDLTLEDGSLKDVPVLAAAEGTVSTVGNDARGFGNYVRIGHREGYSTLYAHLKDGSIKVTEGQPVETGQELGVIGTTGASTGTHLHFEIEFDGASRSDIAALDVVVLEGRKITDYKVEPAPQYFVSTNKP